MSIPDIENVESFSEPFSVDINVVETEASEETHVETELVSERNDANQDSIDTSVLNILNEDEIIEFSVPVTNNSPSVALLDSESKLEVNTDNNDFKKSIDNDNSIESSTIDEYCEDARNDFIADLGECNNGMEQSEFPKTEPESLISSSDTIKQNDADEPAAKASLDSAAVLISNDSNPFLIHSEAAAPVLNSRSKSNTWTFSRNNDQKIEPNSVTNSDTNMHSDRPSSNHQNLPLNFGVNRPRSISVFNIAEVNRSHGPNYVSSGTETESPYFTESDAESAYFTSNKSPEKVLNSYSSSSHVFNLELKCKAKGGAFEIFETETDSLLSKLAKVYQCGKDYQDSADFDICIKSLNLPARYEEELCYFTSEEFSTTFKFDKAIQKTASRVCANIKKTFNDKISDNVPQANQMHQDASFSDSNPNVMPLWPLVFGAAIVLIASSAFIYFRSLRINNSKNQNFYSNAEQIDDAFLHMDAPPAYEDLVLNDFDIVDELNGSFGRIPDDFKM